MDLEEPRATYLSSEDRQMYQQQGDRFQLSQRTIDIATMFAACIVSGDVSVPIDQGQCENALMHGYLLPVLDLMVQHPAFVLTAIGWASLKGWVPSEDGEVSIFEVA